MRGGTTGACHKSESVDICLRLRRRNAQTTTLYKYSKGRRAKSFVRRNADPRTTRNVTVLAGAKRKTIAPTILDAVRKTRGAR